jgi:hypothetical protein
VALTGFGSSAIASAGAIDPSTGFPAWYGDSNGVRLEPCLRGGGNCLLAPGFDPAAPVVVPGNFPDEFFYAHAATDPIAVTDECTPGTPATGQITVEMALEGAFAPPGTVTPGQQIVFTRTRILGDGLCAGAEYTVLTPYGPHTLTAAADGTIRDTVDVDAPLADPLGPVGGQADSFLRWNPNVAPAAPAGYVGDARTPHAVIGGTYVPDGATVPLNAVVVQRAAAELGRTDQFLVSGRIGGPLLASPTTVDFGTSELGQVFPPQQVTITNIGATVSTVATVTFTGTHASLFNTGAVTATTCVAGTSLATDEWCTVDVTFSPTTAGAKSAQLAVTDESGGSVQVALAGTAAEPALPRAEFSTTAVSFGTQFKGTSTTQTVYVSSTGTADLAVGAVTFPTGTWFTVDDQCSNTTVPAGGGFCTVSLTFAPQGTGTQTPVLEITHNGSGDGTQATTSIPVSGTGVASTFTVSPDPGRFGRVRVGQTKTTAITVRNTGTIPVGLTSATVGGADAGAFVLVMDGATTNCLANSLAAGSSCTLTVRFAPTQARNYAATLTVTGDKSSDPVARTIQLTGTGR